MQVAELVEVGDPRRHGSALVAVVGGGGAAGEADGTAGHRLGDDGLHPIELVGRGGALVGLLAHHVQARGGVPHVAAVVEGGAAATDRLEVLRERLELVPRHAHRQGVEAHVLHVLEGAGEDPDALGPDRRDGEAAVARHHGGDAVERRRREVGVPEHLGVVVRVDVDEARRDDVARRVELASRPSRPSPTPTIRPPSTATSARGGPAPPCRRRPCPPAGSTELGLPSRPSHPAERSVLLRSRTRSLGGSNAANWHRRCHNAAMSMPRPEFEGVIGRTYEESEGWWPPVPSAPEGAPNVVIVLLDDVGYAQLGCYGSDIATPCFDRLAGEGHRYSNFHTTALCSPTRACLLTGRNHHSNGMARIVEFAAGFPGYNATIPHENGFLSEILVRNGYATFAVGKWHLTPASEMTMGSPRDKWPLGRGFERFYGFMGGETDQYHPELVYDNHFVEPPRTPEEGYHLTEDLADRAILFMKDLRATAPDKPFFLWFTPGRVPRAAPGADGVHRAVPGPVRPRLGRVARAGVRSARSASGLLPEGTRLSERPAWVPAWDSLTDDERHLYGRMMEIFAGFLTHTDAQVQRVLDFIDELGEADDTIVIVMSDNGASAEGGAKGSFNEQYFFNFVPESTEENLARIDDLGTPRANNHYPWGWAWAGNTPLKRFKRDTHEGGVADPLIVHWPAAARRRWHPAPVRARHRRHARPCST